MIDWTCPNPVFLDFETQSTADIREVGGRLYADHPSTRILSLVADIDGRVVVWFPTLTGTVDTTRVLSEAGLEAYGVDPGDVDIDVGPELPKVLLGAVAAGRTLVAHNALGFDRFIWERFVGLPATWADTLLLARAAGHSGGLDTVAKQLEIGQKDSAKLIAMKLTRATQKPGYVEYPPLLPGMVAPLLRYNAVDVVLLRRLWELLADLSVEADVIAAHDAVNCRGVRVDRLLLLKLQEVSAECVSRAGERIREIAPDIGNIRSVPQMRLWLARHGLRIVDGAGKDTLRKDTLSQYLARPELMLDPDAEVIASEVPPEVIEVLRLRSAALRITGAKAERADARVCPDGRVRDLFAYHIAHTGRWSSSGVQVHNLPRPKKGIDVGRLIELHDSGEWPVGEFERAYDVVASTLPAGKGLTVDDCLSALVRPCFLPAVGSVFLVVDYAAVECRGVAWLAGEDGLLAAFATGGDVYCDFGSKLFGRSITKADAVERQIAKTVVLGCGYGLGADKFGLFCALQGVDLAKAGVTAQQCVDSFRDAYPAIAGTFAGRIDGKPYRKGGLWSKLADAALGAVSEGVPQDVGPVRWAFDGSSLVCRLPSGRELYYREAKVEDRVPGYCRALGIPERARATLVYRHPRGYESQLYGGKITENLVQALCRDLLADALVRLEAAGIPVVLHVHDEIVCEVPVDRMAVDLQTMAGVMSSPPPWAAGFPLAVEGFAAPRYLKSNPKGYPAVEGRLGVAH